MTLTIPAPKAAEHPQDQKVREVYEQVPYPAVLNPFSYPDHLATLARLHGLEPAPVQQCRVLELGCADGTNLIPMALNLPGASLVGIDLSPRQVEAGNQLVRELGLTNIDLRTMSLLDFQKEEGPFDYIIAHGLFSWVDRLVQDKILEIIEQHLAPQGVAYVNYNILPGWHLKLMVRDMALYHTRGGANGLDRVEDVLRFLRALEDGMESRDRFLAEYLKLIRREVEARPNWRAYFLHDYLAHSNLPCYFHQFMQRATAYGLQYLTDAAPDVWPQEEEAANASLQAWSGNRVEAEQYTDYLQHRSFRQTLLCRDNQTIVAEPKTDAVKTLQAACSAQPLPEDKQGAETGNEVRFSTLTGRRFTSQHPMTIETLRWLARVWPEARSFGEILEHLGNIPEINDMPNGVALKEVLSDVLLSLFRSGVVDLRTVPGPCTRVIGKYPKASPLARIQAGQGRRLTNLLHQDVEMDVDAGHFLLLHLDGTRHLEELTHLLTQAAVEGRLDMQYQERPILERENAQAILRQLVLRCLTMMAAHALLVN